MAFLVFALAAIAVCNVQAKLNYSTGDTLRIVNGEPINIREAPHSIAILQDGNGLFCSGGLIHKNWVLTAAHCLPGHLFHAGRLFVGGGLDSIRSAGRDFDIRRVHRMTQHHDYIPDFTAQYDLGLAFFQDPFRESESIKIIPLSADPWPLNKKSGMNCIAAGYGDKERGVEKDGLRKTYVTMVHHNSACPCTSKEKNERLVCSNRPGVTCFADSGSLLNCHGKAWGVAHGVYPPNVCGDYRDGPLQYVPCGKMIATYMYICPFLDWINLYVPNTPRTPSSCRERPRRFFGGYYGTVGDEWNSATIGSGDVFLTIVIQLFFIKKYK